MEYKKLSNGLRIPVLGMGTWAVGGEFEADTTYEKKEINAIKEGIKLGLTHIDTAEFYGEGQAEKEIGIAIKGIDRKRLFITSKVWKDNLQYDNVIKSLNNTLERLQTNYVDLYLIHWPNSNIPIKETMEALEHLVEEGKARSIGVSNFTIEEIKEAQKYLKNNKLVVNQIEYNLLTREAEKDLIPYCEENDILIVAYQPLARGKLIQKGIKTLDEIASKYNKTNAQISLRWLISQKNVVTISKSTNIDHLKQNIDILNWDLKPEDVKRLEEITHQ